MTPAPLHGLQDWYLRASDGEWDAAPGMRVDPRDAGRAWADLPTGARVSAREAAPAPVDARHASSAARASS